jgi:hypothetical protein
MVVVVQWAMNGELLYENKLPHALSVYYSTWQKVHFYAKPTHYLIVSVHHPSEERLT